MYDFDKLTDRRGTGSYKWDVAEGELPMWVADMDFQTAPPIIEAIKRRAEHGIFGYATVPAAWNDAYVGWWRDRHGYEMNPEWLVFTTGVVPAISSIVRKLTTPAENVLIQTPVYNIFFNSILNNGRRVLESPLAYENGVYGIDFEDLERKLADPQTTLMILCNPHNPTRMIQDRETLARIGELCAKHSVTVISDEIHCDITAPGYEYVPFASVSSACADISVTCIAPTKAFSIPGLQTAAVMVPNPVLRHKVERGLNTDEVAEPNAFAIDATIAAFTQGAAWLDEMRAYVAVNNTIATKFIRDKLPQIKPVEGHATYLLWLDCSFAGDSGRLAEHIRAKTGLVVSAGAIFGGNGSQFLRINIACPRERLRDGLERLKMGVESFLDEVKG